MPREALAILYAFGVVRDRLRPHVSAADILKSIEEAMQLAAKSELNACMA